MPHTIPDIRHGENQGLRILGNKRGELKQGRSNQTQTETNDHTERGQEPETPNMDIRGTETQDMGTPV